MTPSVQPDASWVLPIWVVLRPDIHRKKRDHTRLIKNSAGINPRAYLHAK